MRDINFCPVVRQYGRLLEAVVTPHAVENVISDFEILKQLIQGDKSGWAFLSCGGCSPVVQRLWIDKILEKIAACDLTARFIHLLVRHQRLRLLLPILLFYEEARERAGREVVFVTTACPLSASQLKQIEKNVASFSADGVWVRPQVDPELLGGGVLFWGDFMVDGSLKTFLNHVVV